MNARSLLSACAALTLVAGCGGSGDGDTDMGADAATSSFSADAGDDVTDSAPSSSCSAVASYGTVALVDQTASGDGGGGVLYNLEARGKLNQDALPDMLSILLYPNEGPFGDTLSTGVFPLNDKATSFATCGVCVLLDTDTDGATGVKDVYMPTAGTLEIFELHPTFRAELRGAAFRHVLIDVNTFETTDHADGCASAVDQTSFDAPIVNQ